MRIGILGDSHCAAIKRGWDRVKTDHPSIECVFFASRGDNLRHLKIKGNCLVANKSFVEQDIMRTSGGLSKIDPEQYDVFLIYGLKASTCLLEQDIFLSNALRKALVEDLTFETAASILLMRLRKITDKYIYFGHTPLLASDNVNSDVFPQAYVEGIKFLNAEYYALHNAKLLPQPIETITNGHRTKEQYSIGSKRLLVANMSAEELHPSNDQEHMNDDFGQLWMQNFIKNIMQE